MRLWIARTGKSCCTACSCQIMPHSQVGLNKSLFLYLLDASNLFRQQNLVHAVLLALSACHTSCTFCHCDMFREQLLYYSNFLSPQRIFPCIIMYICLLQIRAAKSGTAWQSRVAVGNPSIHRLWSDLGIDFAEAKNNINKYKQVTSANYTHYIDHVWSCLIYFILEAQPRHLPWFCTCRKPPCSLPSCTLLRTLAWRTQVLYTFHPSTSRQQKCLEHVWTGFPASYLTESLSSYSRCIAFSMLVCGSLSLPYFDSAVPMTSTRFRYEKCTRLYKRSKRVSPYKPDFTEIICTVSKLLSWSKHDHHALRGIPCIAIHDVPQVLIGGKTKQTRCTGIWNPGWNAFPSAISCCFLNKPQLAGLLHLSSNCCLRKMIAWCQLMLALISLGQDYQANESNCLLLSSQLWWNFLES